MRSIVMIIALVGLAGCSTQPQTVETKSVPVGAAPSTPAPVATAPAAATPPAAPTVAKKVPSGYRLVKRNGQELYCRSEVLLGSRFPEKMCFTKAQLEEIEKRTDSAMDDLEKGRKVCVGTQCGGS